MFQQILALGEAWRVVRMEYQEKEQRGLVRVEELPARWPQESCRHCGHQIVRGYSWLDFFDCCRGLAGLILFV